MQNAIRVAIIHRNRLIRGSCTSSLRIMPPSEKRVSSSRLSHVERRARQRRRPVLLRSAATRPAMAVCRGVLAQATGPTEDGSGNAYARHAAQEALPRLATVS